MTFPTRFLFRLSFVSFILTVLPLLAARAASVENVRLGVHPGETRMVLEIRDITSFRAFTMDNPYRIAIDMPSFTWKVGLVDRVPHSGVTGIRQGTLTASVSRVIADLDGPAVIKSAFILPPKRGQPGRLVVDFMKTSAGEFASRHTATFGALKTGQAIPPTPQTFPITSAKRSVRTPDRKPEALPDTPVPAPVSLKGVPGGKPLIVIDPGHGGIDPGALGANGVFEKNVSLGMAKALKSQLESGGRYRVMLTRSNDTYLKLHERVDFARRNKADLFISLHADSVNRAGVQGASIYSLSEKASDAQTAKLAARENRADSIGGIDVGAEDEQVAGILVDLVMRDNMNQSNFFANTVVAGMKKSGIRMLENPHRSAGFAVLKAPDIPSVLIEMGFMTNAGESAMLSSDSYRRKVAQTLASGIDSYFQRAGARP